jgi:hypothetical protein
MRPTDVRQRLNRLSELAKGKPELQRVVENLDLVAQEALDATTTYVNKKGEAMTYESPNWNAVLGAQRLAAQLLGLDAQPGAETKQESQPVARILAAVPAPK